MEVGWSVDGGWMVSRYRFDGQQMEVGCLVDGGWMFSRWSLYV